MRRLNVKLALWLLGITLVLVVGVHFLHGCQLERNADFACRRNRRKKQAVEDAIKLFNQYLKYRDDPGAIRLAALVVTRGGRGGDAADWIERTTSWKRRFAGIRTGRRAASIDRLHDADAAPTGGAEHIEYLQARTKRIRAGHQNGRLLPADWRGRQSDQELTRSSATTKNPAVQARAWAGREVAAFEMLALLRASRTAACGW
jgi:hypothetical protein